MDSILVGVTLVSMAVAIALSVIVWRLLREDRRRSEARVAVLADLASNDRRDWTSAVQAQHAAEQLDSTPVRRRQPAPTQTTTRTSNPARETNAPAARGMDLPLHDAPRVAPLFSAPEQGSPWSARAIVMAALALVGTAVMLFALAAHDRVRVESQTVVARDSRAATMPVPPLELVSLRDARDQTTFTITGLVQNPRGGAILKRVTVTVVLFDRTGGFLTSSQALLDVTSLAPGDESPFVLTVPVTASVARYRIGFRSEDGRVISHVDKRQQGAVAAVAGLAVPGT